MSAASGATIYYTTDGSTPSASHGTLYNPATGIVVSGANDATSTISAVSVESGLISSPVVTTAFLIQYTTDTVVPAITIAAPSGGSISSDGVHLSWSSTAPSVTVSAVGPLAEYDASATASLAGWVTSSPAVTGQYFIVWPRITFTSSQQVTIPSIPGSYGVIGSLLAKLWGGGGGSAFGNSCTPADPGGSGGGGGFAQQTLTVAAGQSYSLGIGGGVVRCGRVARGA